MQMLIKNCGNVAHKFKLRHSLFRRNSTGTRLKKELGAAYNPKLIEGNSQDDSYFYAEKDSGRRFSLILPPPNITGILHLGHALAVTIEDVLVRWHRMRGFETVWVPGTDHAGIATQVVVEKRLWKERGLSRHDIGREAFEEEVWRWKEEKAGAIGRQLRRMGASPDWSRETFTMDRAQSAAVTEAFIKLYEAGLIYRSDYLVNWSCVLRSAISDVEVEHLEVDGRTQLAVPGYDSPVVFGQLAKFAYKLCPDQPGFKVDDEIVVATTRPETMFGDVAVAVNPKDTRYNHLIGARLWHPFRNERIPVIADDFVDPDFGTGAVKVTPAHDHNDFEVGRRHGLNSIQVIDEEGKMSAACGHFAGTRRFLARKELLDELNKLNLLRGVEDHRTIVPICSRSRDVVEFLSRPQWFVSCADMARRALEDYESGRLTIEPGHFGRNWTSWLENIRDWCVSRQLWWGHRVPVYFCGSCGRTCVVAARNGEEARSKAAAELGCPADEVRARQDEDVLDTWFSSALLPFSAFGWPQQTEDLEKYYPLSIIETGHDILFFWVARMVMLGTHLTGKLPFSKILLHGIVCDAHGRKMSKSLGNVVAPEDVIYGSSLEDLENSLKRNYEAGLLSDQELKKATVGQKKIFPEGIHECGADALRFTLCSHNIKNHFINFDVQECKINKFFGNKMWQAVKFANKWIETVSAAQKVGDVSYESLGKMDRWILSRLSETVKTVDESIAKYEFHNATAALKNFMYYEFCDIYLEAAKRGLRSPERKQALDHSWTMAVCLDVGLRSVSPFMPVLARHLHERLVLRPFFVLRRPDFPQEEAQWRDATIENEVDRIMEVVVSIRRLKKLFNVTAKHKPRVILVTESSDCADFLDVVRDLSACDKVTICGEIERQEGMVSDRVVDGAVTVLLAVPKELRRAFEVDLQKLEQKRTKLAAELEKIRTVTSAEAYKLNSSERTKEGNAKKITLLEEKIARVDYMRTFSSPV